MTAYTPDHSQDQAIVRAMTDRWRLARLVDRGLVKRRDGAFERRHLDVVRRFVAAIQGFRAASGVNLAIRPKQKKRKKR